MTDREKLVELITEAGIKYATIEGLADHLLSHGVTVKEMQKPLTLDELNNKLDESVWMEFEDLGLLNWQMSPYFFGHFYVEFYQFGDAKTYEQKVEDYGFTWRCWAEKPTEEERKAAEWE